MQYSTAPPGNGQPDRSEVAKHLGIARELIEAGAHLVGCKPDKSPVRTDAPEGSWKDPEASNRAALAAIERGHPYGLVPGSVKLAVVDVDKPDGPKQGIDDMSARWASDHVPHPWPNLSPPEAVESPRWPAPVVDVLGYGIYEDDAYGDSDGAVGWIQRFYELCEHRQGGGPWD